MSRKDKLFAKLTGRPRDFTWNELETLLERLGYRQTQPGKTGGSRRRFVHSVYPTISLHKPHPGNVLKLYQVDQIIEILKGENLL